MGYINKHIEAVTTFPLHLMSGRVDLDAGPRVARILLLVGPTLSIKGVYNPCINTFIKLLEKRLTS